MKRRFSLKQAIDFHGHLGPYLVLGLLMGGYALKKIKAKPHFGLEVKVWGAKDKPKSCLIDGLQLSTGCTYGKGNIHKYNGKVIKVNFRKSDTAEELTVSLSEETVERLKSAVDHSTSEKIAMEFYKKGDRPLFYTIKKK